MILAPKIEVDFWTWISQDHTTTRKMAKTLKKGVKIGISQFYPFLPFFRIFGHFTYSDGVMGNPGTKITRDFTPWGGYLASSEDQND